jgi:hypothetical protein
VVALRKAKIQKPQERKNGGCSQKIPKLKNSKTIKTPKRGLRSDFFYFKTRQTAKS